MTMVITAVWLFQFFLNGMPLLLLGVAGLIGMGAVIAAYFAFPHFQIRIHQFLASGGELSYQVKKSLEAFQSGSLFGRGPGEGVVRSSIPDAHTDFIYAVAAEEYGVFLCLAIVALYLVIVIRSMIISCKDNNLFIILSASGLAASFGLQSIINMASTLHLMPTKGMTLPFISYGGSSIIATAVGMGMLLAITRKTFMRRTKMTSKKKKAKTADYPHCRRHRRTRLPGRSAGGRTFPPRLPTDACYRPARSEQLSRHTGQNPQPFGFIRRRHGQIQMVQNQKPV